MRKNIILSTDSYKCVHWLMAPPKVTRLYAYGEPRLGGKYPWVSFIGPQMIIQDHFLQPVTNEMIEEAEWRSQTTFGTTKYFNKEIWKKVRDLKHLPIRIMTAPEGSKIKEGQVCFTIEATEDWFADSVNGLESLLMHTWYPTAVATRAMYIKQAIKPYFDTTSEIGDLLLPFAVNDFGLRGATCHEAAGRGGVGHLLHFCGSDNEVAQSALYDYYGCKDRLKSVWATEHSIALMWGLTDLNEKEYLIHQLKTSEQNLIISVVIDTKDSDNFIQNIVADPEIKELIKKREGRVVFRPDSGDPVINVIKYLDVLGGIFGYRINTKGYKVLNDNIGLIQGDGMDEESIPNLYKEVTKAGWSAENFVTGSGGGLLQAGLNRDTSRWAIKPSFMVKNGQSFNLSKNPKTDPTKRSKSGRLKLHTLSSTIESSQETEIMFKGYDDQLKIVLENGNFYPDDFKNILERASKF